MPDVTATEAARRFSEILDAADRGESFVVVRRGRAVARIGPAGEANGARVKELLRAGPPDDEWEADLRSVRAMVEPEERDWSD